MGDLGIATATVLFTDLVGSTAHRARLGEDVADDLRRIHDQLLIATVERHRGSVVKRTGDGIHATFDAATDALDAAVAIQQAADAHSQRHRAHAFEIRIGISLGDVSFEDGDVFGTAVDEASRLCDAASGGQILAAELVRSVARGRGGHLFSAVGELELKGLPEPVAAHEVSWEPQVPGLSLPPALSTRGALPFTGRAELMDQLAQAWKQALHDDPGFVLLAGEPGAGKTRLAAEMARLVQDDGAVVLYGHADESLDAPFLAVTEALRGLLAANPERSVSELLGPSASRLTRILPEVLERAPSLEPAASEDPETDRYRTLTAIGDVLRHVATPTGLLLILDDLHWADRATVQTLRMLARSGIPAGVLVVGTYRDTEADLSGPFGQAAAELPRERSVSRLTVCGLDHAGLCELLDAASGDDDYLPEERNQLASLLLDETGGNPYFVGALLLHLAESGALTVRDGSWHLTRPITKVGVPDGVLDLVRTRLSILPDGVGETLAAASVIGLVFEAQLLGAIREVDPEDVVEDLDAAVAAALVDEEGVGRYRFAHALVRSSLYNVLSETRRMHTHLRVAEHLERTRPDAVDALAHHWAQASAASRDAGKKAVEYALAAGRRAMEHDAPDAAVDAYQRSLDLGADLGYGDIAWRAEVLTELAVAERFAGYYGYDERVERAAREALSAGRVDLAAKAIASGRSALRVTDEITPERRTLLEDLIARSDGLPAQSRAGLLAQHAMDASFNPDIAYRDAAVDEAWDALAELSLPEDAQAIAGIANGLAIPIVASLRVDLVARCMELLMEALPFVEGRSRMFGHNALLDQVIRTGGSLDEARRHAEQSVETGERLREPLARCSGLWSMHTVALAQGHLVEAEQIMERFVAISDASDDPDLPVWALGAQAIQRIQAGRLAGQTDFAFLAAEAYPSLAVLRAYAAATLATAGRHEEAGDWLDELARHDFRSDRPDAFYPGLLVVAALAASRFDTKHRARILELLEVIPWVICFSGPPIGPPGHFRGLLRRAMGDLEAAVEDFRSTAAQMEGMGARGYEAQAKAQLAAALEARGRAGDLDDARRLATDACATATELGTGDVLDVCGYLT